MAKISKSASLNDDGTLRFEHTEHGFVFGAATVTCMHGSRSGPDKGRVWFEIETPREKLEVHISASGQVRIWSHSFDQELGRTTKQPLK